MGKALRFQILQNNRNLSPSSVMLYIVVCCNLEYTFYHSHLVQQVVYQILCLGKCPPPTLSSVSIKRRCSFIAEIGYVFF